MLTRFLVVLLLWLGLGLGLGEAIAAPISPPDAPSTATFAGGCFWCMESPFDKLPGVQESLSGYTGGQVVNPSYKQVSSGTTGHRESVQIAYDPNQVSYEQLLDTFWHNVDPFDAGGQFCDRGEQYRAAIFYADEVQKTKAEASKRKLEVDLGQPIATDILPAAPFYSAEDYHQNFYKTNSAKYRFYRYMCGRDRRLEQVWSPQ